MDEKLATVIDLRSRRQPGRGVPESDPDPRPVPPSAPGEDASTQTYWRRVQALRDELASLRGLDDAG